MIKTKKDLLEYLEADRIALQKKSKKPSLFGDEVWKFEIALRKVEYYKNNQKKNPFALYWKFRYHTLKMKCGFTIEPNCFGKGLNIWHYGCIVVNSAARIGDNCTLQQNVNIGKNYGGVPRIGNNVYIGPGAKLFGDIEIADGCVIGANAVVNKSFLEQNKIIAGVPAKVIGDKKEIPVY